MKKYKTKAVVLIGFLFFAILTGFAITLVMAATDDTATGTFQLNAVPSVASVDFQTDAYVTASTIDPSTTIYFRLNFTVTTAGGIQDILNCTVWIFDDSVYGATYNTSSPDGLQLVEFLWVESTDTWTVNDQGAFSEWTIDSAGSDDPGSGSSATSYEFSMRFRISRAARYDTDWNATVHVYDDDSPTAEWDYASESALVTVSQFFDVAYSASTFSWGTNVQPASTNNTHGALSITVLANDQWELRINATDFNDTGGDVDIEVNNVIAWDQDGSNGGISQWIRNTIATLPTGSTWDNQAPMSTEAGLNRNVYIFLSPGVLFTLGELHATNCTVWIQANV